MVPVAPVAQATVVSMRTVVLVSTTVGTVCGTIGAGIGYYFGRHRDPKARMAAIDKTIAELVSIKAKYAQEVEKAQSSAPTRSRRATTTETVETKN